VKILDSKNIKTISQINVPSYAGTSGVLAPAITLNSKVDNKHNLLL
jgi:hypothetical protein